MAPLCELPKVPKQRSWGMQQEVKLRRVGNGRGDGTAQLAIVHQRLVLRVAPARNARSELRHHQSLFEPQLPSMPRAALSVVDVKSVAVDLRHVRLDSRRSDRVEFAAVEPLLNRRWVRREPNTRKSRVARVVHGAHDVLQVGVGDDIEVVIDEVVPVHVNRFPGPSHRRVPHIHHGRRWDDGLQRRVIVTLSIELSGSASCRAAVQRDDAGPPARSVVRQGRDGFLEVVKHLHCDTAQRDSGVRSARTAPDGISNALQHSQHVVCVVIKRCRVLHRVPGSSGQQQMHRRRQVGRCGRPRSWRKSCGGHRGCLIGSRKDTGTRVRRFTNFDLVNHVVVRSVSAPLRPLSGVCEERRAVEVVRHGDKGSMQATPDRSHVACVRDNRKGICPMALSMPEDETALLLRRTKLRRSQQVSGVGVTPPPDVNPRSVRGDACQ
mmetsp:Transcript_53923/g.165919  ORF Transcript_53923/g.165919 Transcript_53923/m.165919 type:complete len:437 (+) Transcript_53923:740-2050(+)